MRLVVVAAVTIPLLCACGSNQPSDPGQAQNTNHRQNIQNAIEIIQQENTPAVPMDGRLRDEHLQMYVSVKIRQEQLRYEQGITYVAQHSQHKVSDKKGNTAGTQNTVYVLSNEPVPHRIYEKQAVKEFEFDDQLYFWAKRTIQAAMARSASEDLAEHKRISSFEESVAAHNLKMIQKYQDELQFALNYKLQPPTSIKKPTSNANPKVAEQQTALFLDPSS